MGIFSKFLSKNINESFSLDFKNKIKTNKSLYKYYKKHFDFINKLLNNPICSEIMIKNIELLISNQNLEEFADIFKNDQLYLFLSNNNLDIKKIQFILEHKNELNQELLDNFSQLSQLNTQGFNNYKNFENNKIKKVLPAIFFDETYYNIWVNNTDFMKYLNKLLMFNDVNIILSKFEFLKDVSEFNNLLTFITKFHKEININTNMKIFTNKYFTFISNYIEYIDFENFSEINGIISCIDNNKQQLLFDYLYAKSKGMALTNLDEVDNIFNLFHSDDLKKQFLRSKITNSIFINDEERHFLENKINDEKYFEIFDLLNRIENLQSEKEFEILYNLVNANKNLLNEYQSLIPIINKSNASKLINDINSIKPNSIIENNGIKIFRFEGNEFKMLIHAVYPHGESTSKETIEKRFNDFNGSISMSLISDKNIHFYKSNPLIYLGYKNIIPSQIVRASSKDAGTINQYQTAEKFVEDPNKMLANNMNTYNEVVVNTILGQQQTPDFILCFNIIDNISMQYAIEKNIPIYLVNLNMYKGRNQLIPENSDNKKDISDLQKDKEYLLQLKDILTEKSINDLESESQHIHK